MRCAYHPGYQAPTSATHPFPMSKFPLLRQLLLDEGLIAAGDLLQPEPLDMGSLALVHTPEYLQKLSSSSLSPAEVRKIGVPWSESLWSRSRLAAGGTLLAARCALEDGMAANLAGGSHHAFAGHGEGFCILNDVAIAVRKLKAENLAQRVLVIDLDVHQGNGTAAIFADDPEVFTFSIHGRDNFPASKMRSSLDLPLPDGAGDAEYLSTLQAYLPTVIDHFMPDLAFYLAGVDVTAGDRYGRLSLSDAGLRARDAAVIGAVRDRGIALTILLAGGYAPSRARTAELHANVFREAIAYERATA